MWAVHDDCWDKDFIKILDEAINSNKDGVSVFCPLVNTDEFGETPISLILKWNYTNLYRLVRLMNLCVRCNDATFYGLQRTIVLKKFKVLIWKWIDSKTPANSNYPVLFYLLSSGKYILTGSYITSIFLDRKLNYFAFDLVKVNTFWESQKNVYLGPRSLLIALATSPALLDRCFFDCFLPIWNLLNKMSLNFRNYAMGG